MGEILAVRPFELSVGVSVGLVLSVCVCVASTAVLCILGFV